MHWKQGLFLSVYVDFKKNAGRKQKPPSYVAEIDKMVDLGEPTSFLDHAYLGCTPRECKPNETIIDEIRKMFESQISARATEKTT